MKHRGPLISRFAFVAKGITIMMSSADGRETFLLTVCDSPVIASNIW